MQRKRNFWLQCVFIMMFGSYANAWSSKLPLSARHRVSTLSNTYLYADRLESDREVAKSSTPYQWLVCPIIAAPVLNLCLSHVVDPSTTNDERHFWIVGLLLAKRVYLYLVAWIAFVLTASRGAAENPSFAQRFQQLNREILGDVYIDTIQQTQPEEFAKFNDSLTKVDDKQVAVALPLVLTGSLLVAYFFLSNQLSFPSLPSGSVDTIPVWLTTALQSLVPLLAAAPTVILTILFTCNELKNLLSIQADSKKDSIAVVVSVLLSLLALSSTCYDPNALLAPWWVHNLLNTFIVITMGRLLQFSSLPVILLALAGLVAYDATLVFGTQALTDNGESIMEAVAKTKLNLQQATDTTSVMTTSIQSTSILPHQTFFPFPSFTFQRWTPGLFEVIVNGRVSDALGLGDVLFPAILGTWSKQFDDKIKAQQTETKTMSTFTASSTGFLIGCLMCEVFQTGQGQPALVFIVPSMIISVLLTVVLNGNLGEMWSSSKAIEE